MKAVVKHFIVLLAFAVTVSAALSAPVVTKVLPSDPAAQDYFGDAVALDGSTLAVGASLKDVAYQDAGAVYVFIRNSSGGWDQQQKVVITDPSDGFLFGSALALSGDTLVVGSPFNYLGAASGGAVYIYGRSGGVWSVQQRLSGTSPFDGDLFGSSVALSGNTLVVGASGDIQNGYPSGAAYVFVRQGSTWVLQQVLLPLDLEVGAFGTATAINGDSVAVGALGDGLSPGSAYVFTRSGTVWSQVQKMAASDGTLDDGFGLSVALTSDTLVVGAPRNSSRGDQYGAAYVFGHSLGYWAEQQRLDDPAAKDLDQYGHSVAVNGNKLLVGSVSSDTSIDDTGAADVYTRTAGVWTLDQRLAPVDLLSHDVFGHSLAVSSGNVVVGSLQYFNFHSGAAYVYQFNQPPVADAGPDLTAQCSASANLDGRASHDPDGDALSYEWREGSLLLGAGATLAVQLPLGLHTVTLTVSDPSGLTSTDSVNVNVVDGIAPVVTAPSTQTVSAGPDGKAVLPNLTGLFGATDNCTASSALVKTQSPAAGTLLGPGSYSVTVQVTDAAGNVGAATATFKVVDTTAPAVVAPQPLTASANANGKVAIPNVVGTLVCSDNCTPADALVRTQSPAAGTLVGLGTTPINITVKDAAGNTSVCSTTLVVKDTTAPVIKSAVVTPNLIQKPNGKMVAVTVSVSASDNCDPGPTSRILSITSDLPAADAKADHTSPDWTITGPLTATVRNEVNPRSNSRIYTLIVQTTDNSGNSTTRSLTITVRK